MTGREAQERLCLAVCLDKGAALFGLQGADPGLDPVTEFQARGRIGPARQAQRNRPPGIVQQDLTGFSDTGFAQDQYGSVSGYHRDQGGGHRIVRPGAAFDGRFEPRRHRLAALNAPLVERVQLPQMAGEIGAVFI